MKEWTCIANEVDDVHGTGVVLAPMRRRDEIVDALLKAGYHLVGFEGDGVKDFREVQALTAAALRLPEDAGANLDALADSLGSLARYWPERERVVLVYENAQDLVRNDLPGWTRLSEVLRDATDDLWRGDGSDDERLFETLALVEGMGV